MIPRLYAQGEPVTVAGVCDAYLAAKADAVRAGLVQDRALAQSARYLECFKADFGTLRVDQCRRGDVKRWLTRHPEYKSPFTKATAAGIVVAAFRWAEEDGLIDRCPYARPKDLPAQEPRAAMTAEEFGRLMAYVRLAGYGRTALAFRLILWFLWETGCRTCEARDLCWEHYDDARGTFELRGKTTGKTGRLRLIVLNRRAWRLVRWLRRKSTGQGHVFLTSRGKPWDKDLLARRFRDYANGAGIRPEVTAYSARHGFCVASLEAGAGERQLADLMGHASTRYIAWYGRSAKGKVDYLRETAELRSKRRET